MLTKFIVDTHDALVEVALWVFLLIGAVAGYYGGKAVDHQIAGLVIGVVVTFFFMAMLMGFVLTISAIRKNVRDLEARYMQYTGER